MQKKVSGWKTKGMNQDLSVSAFNPEFSFENYNLRLSTNEHNTLMSWVNEKGTEKVIPKDSKECWEKEGAVVYVEPTDGGWTHYDAGTRPITIDGVPIGTAVLNKYLVIFTTENKEDDELVGDKPDRIYRFEYLQENGGDITMVSQLLYNGNLKFDAEHPLETLVSYESEDIQKVYWVDGRNQPRVINIVGTIREDYNSQFDFIPVIDYPTSFSVKRVESSSGIFAPGVIQYCFTYYQKNGQQSNIVETSPLYYLSHPDRGASPEEKVSGSFQIDIKGVDTHFDYLRIYSIQRTSLNLEPIVKVVTDIQLKEGDKNVTYIDNGTTGYTIDPYELLYVGGRWMSALTFEEKDNTLFFGNLKLRDTSVVEIQKAVNESDLKPPAFFLTKNLSFQEVTNVLYYYDHQLDKSYREITTFKGGEHYRLGFQLQKETGEWSEPIFIKDVTNECYPKYDNNNKNIQLAEARLSLEDLKEVIRDFLKGYQRIRPVIVYPTIGDRKVLCQGVLNPTVFNAKDRVDNSPYAQASWYFRPVMNKLDDSEEETSNTPVTQDAPAAGNDYTDPDVNSKVEYKTENTLPVPRYNNNDSGSSTFEDSQLKKYYIAIFTFPDAFAASQVLSQKYIDWKREQVTTNGLQGDNAPTEEWIDVSETGTSPFWGAIRLETNTQKYALLSTVPWVSPNDFDDLPFNNTNSGSSSGGNNGGGTSGGGQGDSDPNDNPNDIQPAPSTFNDPTRKLEFYYYVGSAKIKGDNFYTTEEAYSVPSVLDDGPSNKVYLPANSKIRALVDGENKDVFLNDVSFCFWADNEQSRGYYECLFEPLVFTGDTTIKGNSLAWHHYESLPEYGNNYRTEIQGAINNYNTAITQLGDDSNDKKRASNTQFFVDQSIVTLNSPDIEFDTEVQVYGTDTFKLKVIGYIPITSNVSSHSILASSGMLEVNHNKAENSKVRFGVGELNNNVRYYDNKAGNRLVAALLWDDVHVVQDIKYEDKITTAADTQRFVVYPWHRNGSLNDDVRSNDITSSMLKTKVEANLLFSNNTTYLSGGNGKLDSRKKTYEKVDIAIHLTENEYVHNIRLDSQYKNFPEINYYPNIDKVLYNTEGYQLYYSKLYWTDPVFGKTTYEIGEDTVIAYSPIPMKYKSTSHAVIAIQQDEDTNQQDENANCISLPNTHMSTSDYKYEGTTFWNGENNIEISETSIDGLGGFNYLWLGELYRDEVTNAFGGETDEAIQNNVWLIAGKTLSLSSNDNNLQLVWEDGDTFYQRYDCLKTYPFTFDDPNQIVEILSFMCETRQNIDGRYDRNRGQTNNNNMHPKNFNLWNSVYSQRNNFFTSRRLTDAAVSLEYPNQITWSKTKENASDIDIWTNVTLANTLDLDGDKGEVRSLNRLNDQLICFQDTGISQVLYNENTQISTTQGVPIEIANSGKVQGRRYLSDTVGCSNKWSIVTTPMGIYFIDSYEKSIYLFNGQLNNLSLSLGFNTWCKQHIPEFSQGWTPDGFEDFVAYYDRWNRDVLFINQDTALSYSEKLGAFTSFYDYGKAPYFCNFGKTGVWLNTEYSEPQDGEQENEGTPFYLWKHQEGSYCNFFGENKPYGITLIGNPEPQLDKIFTNLEFRACVDGDGNWGEDGKKFRPHLPFSNLEVWNEYQKGRMELKHLEGHSAMQHHRPDSSEASLHRKFRIWRCDIPRHNVEINGFRARPFDRIRNPWAYIKLWKQEAETEQGLPRAEIHDILLHYFS